MTRVAFVSQWYTPEPLSAQMPTAIATSIHRAGFDVHVVTGIPNYPRGYPMSGYEGKFFLSEQVAEVTVDRVRYIYRRGSSVLRRVCTYVSFAAMTIFKLRVFLRADIIVAYCTPPMAGVVAQIVGKLCRKPVVLIVQDLWPDVVLAALTTADVPLRFPRVVVDRCLHSLSAVLYQLSSSIIVISDEMAIALRSRIGKSRNIKVLLNPPLSASIERLPAPKLSEFGPFRSPHVVTRILYAGHTGIAQDLETFIEVLSLCSAHSQIELLVAGPTGVAYSQTASSDTPGSLKVVNLGLRSQVEILQLRRDVDFNVILLANSEFLRTSVPSKLAECLWSGRPVLAVGAGALPRMVQSINCGLTASPDDPESICVLAKRATTSTPGQRFEWGTNGWKYAHQNLRHDLYSDAIGRHLGDELAQRRF